MKRLVLAAAVAAAAVLAPAAHATVVCFDQPTWPYVCHDTDHPDCLLYGNVGREGAFQIGDDCPPPYPG